MCVCVCSGSSSIQFPLFVDDLNKKKFLSTTNLKVIKTQILGLTPPKHASERRVLHSFLMQNRHRLQNINY